MFRKLLFAVPLAGILSLGGCATIGGKSPSSIIEQIRQVSVSICGFLPDVAVVAAIIAAGNPAVVGVGVVAKAICDAVDAVPPLAARKRGATAPTVAGVVVHGHYVR